MTLSVDNPSASLPIAYQLYLPEIWANDALRRTKAHVPDEVTFKTKPQIALEQIAAALAAGVAPGIVLADAGYGSDGEFRAGLTAMGLKYAVGVQSRAKHLLCRCAQPLATGHGTAAAKDLALSLPAEAWREVEWREGSIDPLTSRFAAVRVRPASRDWKRCEPHLFEWLLVEWPKGEKESAKYFLSTLPEDVSIEILVDTAKMRWRIERDYEELKCELGLAHFEGRGWRGFHHHATLCIAAYGFLIRERADFSPSGTGKRQKTRLPTYIRPVKPAGPARTARPKLDSDDPKIAHRRPRQNPRPLPLLPDHAGQTAQAGVFMTQ